MKRTCEGCYWFGKCTERKPCGQYDPIDDGEWVVHREQILDKKNFIEDWLLYMNRDSDVDYCEEPVNSSEHKLVLTKGGDRYQ